MTSEEVTGLLPCPFCGTDDPFWDYEGPVHWQICCNGIDCQASTLIADSREQAIARWNRRSDAALTTLSATIDELRSERDALRHDVESAGALRLRMEAHKATAHAAESQLTELREALEREREECAKVADTLSGYSGEGTEDRNDGFGMFARGVRHAKRAIAAAIRSRTTGDVP